MGRSTQHSSLLVQTLKLLKHEIPGSIGHTIPPVLSRREWLAWAGLQSALKQYPESSLHRAMLGIDLLLLRYQHVFRIVVPAFMTAMTVQNAYVCVALFQEREKVPPTWHPVSKSHRPNSACNGPVTVMLSDYTVVHWHFTM